MPTFSIKTPEKPLKTEIEAIRTIRTARTSRTVRMYEQLKGNNLEILFRGSFLIKKTDELAIDFATE